ncbi:ABC transporter ATP-binding protein (fragment) [Enterobacterales bacterium 8AC]
MQERNIAALQAAQRTPLLGVLFQEAGRQFFRHRARDEIAFGLRHQGIRGMPPAITAGDALSIYPAHGSTEVHAAVRCSISAATLSKPTRQGSATG